MASSKKNVGTHKAITPKTRAKKSDATQYADHHAVKTASSKPSPALAKVSTMPRVLPRPTKRWYKPSSWYTAAPKPAYIPVAKARSLLKQSLYILWQGRKPVGLLVCIYSIATILFVGSLVAVHDIVNYRQSLEATYTGIRGTFEAGVLQFGFLLGGGNADGLSGAGSVYQSVLVVLCSLAIIYIIRELYAARIASIKEAFYESTGPLVPFLGVSAVITVQLLPLSLAAFLYTLGMVNGLAVHWWEQGIVLCLSIALLVWSLRMLLGSIFALYIVTLPGMTPLRALKTARTLVYKRRLMIAGKITALTVFIIVTAAAIEIPVIIVATTLAPWLLILIGAVAFVVIHSYLYALYRELL
jgi:hypothetical protein